MTEQRTLLTTLSSFGQALTGPFSVTEVLYDLAEQITGLLGVAGTGVSLVEGGSIRFIATSSDAVCRPERLQEQLQSGPCVQAVRERATVVVNDLGEGDWSTRWPRYVALTRVEGINSVAGIPMLDAEGCIGTIAIYRSRPHAWTEEELLTVAALAAVAAGYVRHASEIDRQRRLVEQLQHALDSRIVIEQAKGILAHASGISVDRAFEILRRYARSHNANLGDVATAVVRLGLRIETPGRVPD